MNSRILLDEHFSPKIATALRECDIDAIAVAGHSQLESAADDTILEWATREGCALLTENVRDFMPLLNTAMERNSTPAGLICTSSRNFPRSPDGRGRLVKALTNLAASSGLPRPGEVHWL